MCSRHFQRKFEPGSRLHDQGGQGVVEYILVVTVSVIIIASLWVKLYKPLGDFVGAFMGEYVACLLETGELPRMGATSGGAEDGACPLPDFAGGKDSESNQQAKDSAKSQSASSDADADKDKGTGASGAGAAARQSKSFVAGSASRGSPGMDGAKDGKKIENALDGEDGGNGFFSSRNGQGSDRRLDKYRAITGVEAEEVKKRKGTEKNRRTNVAGESGPGLPAKKIAIKKPEKKERGPADDEVKTLDITEIVKYILIAGILIIIVVLLGGQAYQLSKSWEKAE